MKARCGIAVMLVALAALIFAAVPATAPASITLNSYEKQIMTLVNQKRAKHGLAKLRISGKLVKAARAHSADMGTQQYFEHNAPGGETWSQRIIRFGYTREGYRFWKAGENIFWGSGLLSSPTYVVNTWMHSDAHRAVILTKSFREIGIGAVKHADGYLDCTSPAWFFTLDLGRRIAS